MVLGGLVYLVVSACSVLCCLLLFGVIRCGVVMLLRVFVLCDGGGGGCVCACVCGVVYVCCWLCFWLLFCAML